MAINHKAAKEFAKRWAGKTWSEDQFAGVFWIDLLKSVYDIECNDTSNVIFEYRTSASGKIDLWLRNLSTMVEMKSSGVDLDKPEPRQGEMKTPFKQVYDYAVSFPRSEQPDYLITCNFEKFRVYSRKEYGDLNLESKAQEFTVEELGDKPEYLSFLIDPQNSRLYHEREISEQAGQLIGKLYDMLREQYIDPDSEDSKHSLNVLCVRLVFCLFCEDAGLFNEMDAFYNFLKDVPASNIRINLQRLFKNLDIPKENRDKYDEAIRVFPYVNGGLFREDVEIPNFTNEIKSFLLDELSQSVDWSKISPTIFGGIFESTLNPETRRKGGMHYTSPENIHKVIDPLFLDDLKAEFEAIRTDEELSVIKKRNKYRKFHEKLCSLVFFDPACGSGNFLTETYICLKQLEYAVLKEYKSKQMSLFDSSVEGEIELRVKLDQFYGIEINDFAVSVAETALWISRLKSNKDYMLLLDLDEKDFPLDERANIICDNALRFDWNNLIEPSRVSFIIGNPPFAGARWMTKEQKDDLISVFGSKWKNVGDLDYVCCWYKLATEYMKGSSIRSAFVSTNSITQGVSVVNLWKPLFEQGIHIDFAYQTFIWDSEASIKAHVHCVIVGFSYYYQGTKKIYNGSTVCEVNNINGYLLGTDDVFIEKMSKPISNVPPISLGGQAIDDGNLILSIEEKDALLKKEPQAKAFIRPYMMGKDFIERRPRYCLWLVNADKNTLNACPSILDRIDRVLKFRLSSSRDNTLKAAKEPALFATCLELFSNYIAIPKVSSQNRKYIPMDYLTPDIIPGDKLFTMPDATEYEFGVLMSIVHMAWTRAISGRLKSDYSYSNTLVYNNFPWPNPTNDQKAIIEQTAQGILDARELYPGKSLADLYDPDKMPEELRIAHEANDKAVMDAYGFASDMGEPEIVAELMKLYQKLTEQH